MTNSPTENMINKQTNELITERVYKKLDVSSKINLGKCLDISFQCSYSNRIGSRKKQIALNLYGVKNKNIVLHENNFKWKQLVIICFKQIDITRN